MEVGLGIDDCGVVLRDDTGRVGFVKVVVVVRVVVLLVMVEGLALDSIDALEIIVLLEKEYGLKIDDPKKGKDIMKSVQSLADYIESKS